MISYDVGGRVGVAVLGVGEGRLCLKRQGSYVCYCMLAPQMNCGVSKTDHGYVVAMPIGVSYPIFTTRERNQHKISSDTPK